MDVRATHSATAVSMPLTEALQMASTAVFIDGSVTNAAQIREPVAIYISHSDVSAQTASMAVSA